MPFTVRPLVAALALAAAGSAHATPLFVNGLALPAITNCGNNPLDAVCCTEFKVGASIDTKIGGSAQAQVAVQAVADFSGIAAAAITDLTTACRSMASELDASAAGAVDVTIDVGTAYLENPTFVIHGWTSTTAPSAVTVDGTTLVANQGYFASVRAGSSELWITLNAKARGAGHRLVVTK